MINRTVESTFGCGHNYIFHEEDVESRAVPFLNSFLLKYSHNWFRQIYFYYCPLFVRFYAYEN